MEFLKGKTLIYIEVNDLAVNLVTSEGEMYHMAGEEGPPNDCHIWVESVVGDIEDLLNRPLLMAEESSNVEGVTWTFYKFATIKGYVDIRFCGESNGYYCEKATFYHLGKTSLEELEKFKANRVIRK
jgi:hypothetical protein